MKHRDGGRLVGGLLQVFGAATVLLGLAVIIFGLSQMPQNNGYNSLPFSYYIPAITVVGWGFGIVVVVKLPRFRGHRTIWVRGVHDGEDKVSLPA